MKTALDIVVMGDINLDWSVDGLLPLAFADLQTNGVILWASIQELPGGSGLNFARFALEAGYKTLLLGRVGNDIAGRHVKEWLVGRGIGAGVTQDATIGTGRAMIARDKNDVRFLVNNQENANHALSISDVEAHSEDIRSCRVLYISGYCLMRPDSSRTQAALRAMEIAKELGRMPTSCVVFDVVPHQIYKIYTSFDEFRLLTKQVDILISEVATMRRYLGLGSPAEQIDRAIAEETVEHLKNYYSRFTLRYGSSGCDEQILYDGLNGVQHWEETDHNYKTVSEKRGYGDKLTISTLQHFFGIKPQELG
jgi:sugar/nucleoside kinase (ribokinase family)